MTTLPTQLTMGAVNDELKKLNSSEVLTVLLIDEVAVTEQEGLQLQTMWNSLGHRGQHSFRKLFIRFTTVSGKNDTGDCLYIKTGVQLTAKRVAESVIKELTVNQLPQWKRVEISLEALRNEQKFVLLISAVIITLFGCVCLLANHSTVSSPFFHYGAWFGSTGMAACCLLDAYFLYNPGPGRRPYFYGLVGISAIWFGSMVLTLI